MKAIKIDTELRKIYEVEVADPNDINEHIGGGREKAHTFKTGDLLFVDSDGGYKDVAEFMFGSRRYGFQTFRGNGIIAHRTKDQVWSSSIKTVADAKRFIRFPKAK
jgi:hypothetical protein